MATNPREQAVQQWPRYIVGFFASYRILAGLHAVWLGISMVQNDMVYSSEDEALVKASRLVGGSLSIIFNSIALYAVIRKSVTAAKFSFVVYSYLLGLFFISFALIAVITIIAGKDIPNFWPSLDEKSIFIMILILALDLGYGWSLLVFLRDIRGQARDKWGRLLKETYEDRENDGAIKL